MNRWLNISILLRVDDWFKLNNTRQGSVPFTIVFLRNSWHPTLIKSTVVKVCIIQFCCFCVKSLTELSMSMSMSIIKGSICQLQIISVKSVWRCIEFPCLFHYSLPQGYGQLQEFTTWSCLVRILGYVLAAKYEISLEILVAKTSPSHYVRNTFNLITSNSTMNGSPTGLAINLHHKFQYL